ncbi:MAG: Fe-S-containing hydro-lyase [Dehalococcoidia bacterium]|nr:Fe-S-containing hydro-lyase [Dehalococcoidia bacterium]
MTGLKVGLPLDESVRKTLRAGDAVLLSGVIYTARDAAHKRMAEALEKGVELPFDINGQTIYYMGPAPARPGAVIGSCGPTTSGRMDAYTPQLLEAGLAAMIGKGERSAGVREAIRKAGAVYFVTYGGVGALLSKAVRKAEVVAYPELGAEAIMRLEVDDFPVIVANDMHGGDLFSEQISKYRRG